MPRPEDAARADIDGALVAAGWVVQDRDAINLDAGPGVAVREFPLRAGFGFADYLLYVHGQAVGVIEAKAAGTTLTGVEVQAEKYAAGIPDHLDPPVSPLPFLYQSTGVETRVTNRLDPAPRSRTVFQFHRPETLGRWIAAEPVGFPVRPDGTDDPRSDQPASFRTRLTSFPALATDGLRAAQIRAVGNLEESLAENHPRALVQMATGSGKTVAAITSIYRLIKHGDASRVLFLVDRDKAPAFRRFVDGLNKGSLIQHMFTSQLDDFALPLPPLTEQHRIVDEVDRLLSIADETETTLRAQHKRAEALRRAILKHAFDGKLVLQDPNDEPANVMLENLTTARQASASIKPRRSSARRPTPTETEP